MIQHTSNFPRFGFCFPARTFKAVDFPIPFVPTNPKTSPGLGVGNLELRCTIMTYSTSHVHIVFNKKMFMLKRRTVCLHVIYVVVHVVDSLCCR